MASSSLAAADHRHFSRLAWTGLGITLGVILIAGIADYIQQHQRRAAIVQRAASTATPLSYSDFIGTVTAMNGQVITIDMVVADERGQTHHRSHRVTVNDQTRVASLDGQTLGNLAYKDIQLADRVQAVAATNLSGVDHFTATKLFKFIHP